MKAQVLLSRSQILRKKRKKRKLRPSGSLKKTKKGRKREKSNRRKQSNNLIQRTVLSPRKNGHHLPASKGVVPGCFREDLMTHSSITLGCWEMGVKNRGVYSYKSTYNSSVKKAWRGHLLEIRGKIQEWHSKLTQAWILTRYRSISLQSKIRLLHNNNNPSQHLIIMIK